MFQLSARLGKELTGFDAAARDKLSRHGWPGNVRELKNVVERAAILCDQPVIGARHVLLVHELGRDPLADGPPASGDGGRLSLRAAMERYERDLLESALKGRKSLRQAARELGLSHTALLAKVKKHHLA